MLGGMALMVGGYACLYYSANVLVWAHVRTDTAPPVPLAACFGLPVDGGAAADWHPLWRLGSGLPGATSDPRALFGVDPTGAATPSATAAVADTASADIFGIATGLAPLVAAISALLGGIAGAAGAAGSAVSDAVGAGADFAVQAGGGAPVAAPKSSGNGAPAPRSGASPAGSRASGSGTVSLLPGQTPNHFSPAGATGSGSASTR